MGATRRLCIMGPPGSGKSTQAKLIARELGLAHISTGQLLRREAERESRLGAQARPYMSSGELVPDDLVLKMLAERISASDAARGHVLDGFPRTLAQARAAERELGRFERVIELRISDAEAIRRLSGRLHCDRGHVYQEELDPPRSPGRCDVDGEPLRRREDDEPDSVRNRLNVYRRQTRPLIAYFQAQGVLTPIDGHRDPDGIKADILEELGGSRGAGVR